MPPQILTNVRSIGINEAEAHPQTVSNQQQNMRQENGNAREPITLFLITDKKTYQGGGSIRGTVSLFIPQSAVGCNDFSGIHLLLEGKETVDMLVPESLKLERYNDHFVRLDKQAIQLRSPLIPGQYEYSFYFKLPESLPSSMHCISKEDDRCTCDIHYHFTAYIRRRRGCGEKPGNCTVVNCTQLIRIAAPSSPMIPATPLPVLGSSSGNNSDLKTFVIRSFLRSKGAIDLGVEMDKTVVAPHSSINVTITGRNRSSKAVKYISVRWIETIRWGRSDMETFAIEKILGETKVDVDHLPSWQKHEIEKGQKKRVCDGVLPPTETLEVQLQLKNAKNSYKGELVQIHHSLEVVVVTKGKFVTKPKMAMVRDVQQRDEVIPVAATAQLLDQQEFPPQCVPDNQQMIPEAVPVLMENLLPIEEAIQQEQQHRCASNDCGSIESLSADSCSVFTPVVQAQIMEPVGTFIMTQDKGEAFA